MAEDMVFGVGFGIPGSINFTVSGVSDTPEDAARMATEECDAYLDHCDHAFKHEVDERWWLRQMALRNGLKHREAIVAYAYFESGTAYGYVEVTGLRRGSPEEREWRIAAACDGWRCDPETLTDNFDVDEDGYQYTRPDVER